LDMPTPKTVVAEKGLDRAIKVKMVFFGPLMEQIGSREIEVSVEEGLTVLGLADRFELSGMLSSGLRIAIDGVISTDLSKELRDSSEVAFLPPVSGG